MRAAVVSTVASQGIKPFASFLTPPPPPPDPPLGISVALNGRREGYFLGLHITTRGYFDEKSHSHQRLVKQRQLKSQSKRKRKVEIISVFVLSKLLSLD